MPIILADIVFTQSRAAYLATAALAAAAALKRPIRKKVLAAGLVCGLIAGAVGIGKYTQRAETIVTEGARGAQAYDGSVATRILLWQHALEFFGRNPITGVGLMNSGLLIKEETSIGKAKSLRNT